MLQVNFAARLDARRRMRGLDQVQEAAKQPSRLLCCADDGLSV